MPMTDPACIPMFPEPSHKHLLHIQCQLTIECNSLEGDCHEVQSGMMPLQHAAHAAPTVRCKPADLQSFIMTIQMGTVQEVRHWHCEDVQKRQ